MLKTAKAVGVGSEGGDAEGQPSDASSVMARGALRDATEVMGCSRRLFQRGREIAAAAYDGSTGNIALSV